MDIGKRYKKIREPGCQARKAKRLTQLELAALLETDQVYISRLECGKIGPTLAMIARIAECFKTTISELYGV
jgi:transcriptional regulator with XRE-family HTH domain